MKLRVRKESLWSQDWVVYVTFRTHKLHFPPEFMCVHIMCAHYFTIPLIALTYVAERCLGVLAFRNICRVQRTTNDVIFFSFLNLSAFCRLPENNVLTCISGFSLSWLVLALNLRVIDQDTCSACAKASCKRWICFSKVFILDVLLGKQIEAWYLHLSILSFFSPSRFF
jgi:hypothetical protein